MFFKLTECLFNFMSLLVINEQEPAAMNRFIMWNKQQVKQRKKIRWRI